MKYSFATFFSVLIAAVIFTAPSNLFYVLNEDVGYVNGMRIDYLMPKLYLSDIFIVLTIIFGLTKIPFSINKFAEANKSLIILILLLFISSLFFSEHHVAAVAAVVKSIEFSLFAFVVWKLKHLLNKDIIVFTLGSALAVQTIVALLQFFLQHSVTPYWLFGETQYTSSTIAIARAILFAQEKILSYGTTAHPNVLAGTVVLFSVLLAQLKNNFKILLLVNALLIVFLTQSISAILALIIAIPVLYFPHYIRANNKNIFLAGLLLFVTVPLVNWLVAVIMSDSFSVFRRHELNVSAIKMFWEHRFAGVGLGNFTAYLEPYLRQKELVRFIQPAHHIGILWLAETGLLGIAVAIEIYTKIRQHLTKIPLLFLTILPIISLDHYVMTIQTGTVSVLLFLVLITKKTR